MKKANLLNYDNLDNHYSNGSQSQRHHFYEHKTHVKLENQSQTGNHKCLSKLLSSKNCRDAKTSKKLTTLNQQNISEVHGDLNKTNLVKSDDLDYNLPKDSHSFINRNKTNSVEHDIVLNHCLFHCVLITLFLLWYVFTYHN